MCDTSSPPGHSPSPWENGVVPPPAETIVTRTVCLTLHYAGTAYAGWQLQAGMATVQGTIEAALERLLDAPVRVHGAGRTDAGVHARAQRAHFETDSALAPDQMRSALNHFLPWDVRVTELREARPGFHARESALSKEYRYRVYRGETMPPECYPYALLVRRPLDRAALDAAANRLVGTHDFAALRSGGSSALKTVRTVLRSEWLEEGAEMVYRIEADGFLYKMVRIIVGTLLEVGRGRRPWASIGNLLEEASTDRAGPVAPARGLHLWQVNYPPGDLV